ncbi:MAG: hypothetical protein IKL01_03820 [Mailhella sp.]|nr:hypothetical protein [Mailhella sp.]
MMNEDSRIACASGAGTGAEKPGFLHRARRGLAVALCAVLAVAVACMAVAVLLQAVAVLLVAALAAALLLPHPLKWYAKEGAEAVKLFVHELFGNYMKKE